MKSLYWLVFTVIISIYPTGERPFLVSVQIHGQMPTILEPLPQQAGGRRASYVNSDSFGMLLRFRFTRFSLSHWLWRSLEKGLA